MGRGAVREVPTIFYVWFVWVGGGEVGMIIVY